MTYFCDLSEQEQNRLYEELFSDKGVQKMLHMTEEERELYLQEMSRERGYDTDETEYINELIMEIGDLRDRIKELEEENDMLRWSVAETNDI